MSYNQYTGIKGNECIALENNQIGIILNHGQIAIIDSSYYRIVKDYTWHAKWSENTKSYYVATTIHFGHIKTITLRMHQVIMGTTDLKLKVDHKNQNTLDNTFDNLRIADDSESACNRKGWSKLGIKNIYFLSKSKSKQWLVLIQKHNAPISKCFDSIFSALDWRDEMKDTLHSDFAHN